MYFHPEAVWKVNWIVVLISVLNGSVFSLESSATVNPPHKYNENKLKLQIIFALVFTIFNALL